MSGDPDSNLKCVASGQAYSLASVSLRSLSRSHPQAIPSRASEYLAGAVSYTLKWSLPKVTFYSLHSLHPCCDIISSPFSASLEENVGP